MKKLSKKNKSAIPALVIIAGGTVVSALIYRAVKKSDESKPSPLLPPVSNITVTNKPDEPAVRVPATIAVSPDGKKAVFAGLNGKAAVNGGYFGDTALAPDALIKVIPMMVRTTRASKIHSYHIGKGNAPIIQPVAKGVVLGYYLMPLSWKNAKEEKGKNRTVITSMAGIQWSIPTADVEMFKA